MKAGVAAELARHHQSDAREFFQLLVLLLEGALPEVTVVERRGAFLGKKRPVRVTVALDDYEYALEDTSRQLVAMRRHIVRGIALKTEDIEVAQWIEALSAALEERARSGAKAREALERLLN